MARTEDGEVEWILGNRQLLSVFFVVVILLGVFFTLGYVVGRGSGGSPETTQASSKPGTSATAPLVVDPATTEQGTTAPDVAKAAPVPARRMPDAPERKPDPVPTAGEKPQAAASGEPQLIEPQPGQVFVQIGASNQRPEAYLVASSIGRKGFPVVVAQTPDKTKYRILVGPLLPKDTALISKTKADMEALGFNKPFVQKFK